MEPRPIIFLMPGFPKNEQDINCMPSVQLLIRALQQANPLRKIAIISFHYPFESGMYEWNSIKIWACGGQNRQGIFQFRTWWRAWQAVRYFHLSNSILHSFWLGECTFIGYILSKIYKLPLYANLQGQDCLPQNNYLKLIRFLQIPIISISTFGAELLQKSTGISVQKTIPYGLDFEIQQADQQENIFAYHILGVGNLIPVKNYSLFIEIIQQLVQEFPQLKSAIIGGGIEENKLNKMIREKQLTDHIQLLGELPRPQVLEYMAKSRIFLHTSSHEGQGFVLMEALASGAEVVAFPVGYLPPSPRSHICATSRDIKLVLSNLLNKPITQTSPIPLPTMLDSAREYEKIYDHV